MIPWWLMLPWVFVYLAQESRVRKNRRDYESAWEMYEWQRERHYKYVDKCWKEHDAS